ncbi:MAG: hypothetical protein ACC633_01395 [Anaerolineales bacterium]
MINWFQLFTNSLWIFALALVLAVLSYARWESKMGKGRFNDLLNKPPGAFLINMAGLLFCLGLAMMDQAWWQRLLWGVLVLLFAAQIWKGGKLMGRQGDGERGKELTERRGEQTRGLGDGERACGATEDRGRKTD